MSEQIANWKSCPGYRAHREPVLNLRLGWINVHHTADKTAAQWLDDQGFVVNDSEPMLGGMTRIWFDFNTVL